MNLTKAQVKVELWFCLILVTEYFGSANANLATKGVYHRVKVPRQSANRGTIVHSRQSHKSQMDEVIIQLLNALKANMTMGFPNYGIPVLEPFKMEYIPVNISEPQISLDGNITNFKVVGLSRFEILNVSSEFPRFVLDIQLRFPALEISGEYNVKGKAGQVLPIFGSGPFSVNLTELTLAFGCSLQFKTGNRISMEELHYQIQIEKIEVNIEGLMGGGEFGKTLNDIINSQGLQVFVGVIEPKFHDQVVASLLEKINELLKGISLVDIIGGGVPSGPVIELPTIWSKNGERITRADTSSYVDIALASLRQYMVANCLNRIPLDNQTEKFSERFLGVTWHGEAALYDGVLTGLETIHRSGPANLNLEETDIVFDAELEVNDAGLEYSMLAKFMGLGPTATVIGNLESIRVYVKCRVFGGFSNVTLDEFKVLDLGQLSIDVYGLGVLGFITEIIGNALGNSLGVVVAKLLENTIKSMLNEIIGDLLFPLNVNGGPTQSDYRHLIRNYPKSKF
jgi:hypothetical protein